MNTTNIDLWIEKYRPKTFKDVILPERYYKFFENLLKKGELPHLIFAGSQGRGKTSLAKALANDFNRDMLYINASLENSIDVIRYNVNKFAMTKSIYDKKKLIILDEADRLVAGQDALKVILEQTSKNTTFIFCTNYLNKIIDPLKSRCQIIQFEYTADEAKEIKKRTYQRIVEILLNEGIKEIDKTALKILINKLFPDIRKIINELQFFYNTHGKITADIVSKAAYLEKLDELIEILKEKNFNKLKQEIKLIDPELFYRSFYNKLEKYIEDKAKPEIILILAEYGYRHGFSVDPLINMLACCIQIMKLNPFKK